MNTNPVDRFLRRIKTAHVLTLALQLALIGAGAWIAAKTAGAASERYASVYGMAAAIVMAAALLIVLIQVLVRFFQRTELRVAQELDSRFGLKDRLSTYIEIRRLDHPFLPALAVDTQIRLRDVSVWSAANPVRAIAPSALLPACLLALLFLIPFLPVPKSIALQKQEQEQIRTEAQSLEREIRELQKKKELSPDVKKLLDEALKEAKDMQKPGVEKADALKRLNSLENKLAQIQKLDRAEKQQQLAKSLQDAKSGSPENGSDAPSSEEIKQLAKDIQDALGNNTKDLQGSKENPASPGATPMSKQQMEAMKKALEEYKKSAADTEQRMAEMQKALDNARSGIGGGKHKVTSDSRVKDRDVEKGKGGVDDGPGTTNKDVGPQHFSTKKTGAGEYAEDKTKAKYEQLYKGERTNAANDPLMLGSKWNDSGELTTQRIRSFGLDSDATASRQGGSLAGQNSQESEIRKEKVPASYQKMVKEYFESIQEGKNDD